MNKKIVVILFLVLPLSLKAQVQTYAPWANSQQTLVKNSAGKKNYPITLKEISSAAQKHFNTIDINKKGSGFKPFKRWEYHWSNYLKEDGTIAPAADLWQAWKEKQALRKSNTAHTGDWASIGPYENSNTYNAQGFKQTGQGRINAIAVDPSNNKTYYVGTPAGGIWKSTDAGLNWTPLTDYLPQIGVSGIAIDPTDSNTIYIATGDDDADDSYAVGVWKSIDGGQTWNNTGALEGNPTSMNEIYIMPSTPTTVLVATSTGVHKTSDGGATWRKKLDGKIIDLKMKPNDEHVWYAITKERFYKSTNGGETFAEKAIAGLTNSSRMVMDVTKANADYVYLVSASNNHSSFNGVFKSTNAGESFTRTSETNDIFDSTQAWYDLALTVSDTNPDIVYVGVLDIWKSTNGGDRFSKINEWWNPNTPSYTHADIHFLRFIEGRFFAGTDGGIYVSDDEGVSFVDLTKNLAISQFYTISISQQREGVVAGGLQDNGGFAFTDKKWYNYHGGDGLESVVDVNNSEICYGFTQFGGALSVSEDGGKSQTYFVSAPSEETNANIGDSGGEWLTPLVTNSNGEIYAAYGSLYKLVGRQWQKVSTSSFGGDIDQLEIDPQNNNVILVSQNRTLYRSLDKGVTFTSIHTFSSKINAIEISNTNPEVVWVVIGSGVYKSENYKNEMPTFLDITNNLPSENKLTIKHHARSGNNTLYLGTNLGVYYTNDTLYEWKTFDNKLPNTQVRDLAINEEASIIYAATYGRGVFMSSIPSEPVGKDIKLVAIDAPSGTEISASTNIVPKITVKNMGTTEVTHVSITYTIDNGVAQNTDWTGSLPSNNELSISLPAEHFSVGHHTLNVTIATEGDVLSSNNSLSVSFLVNGFNNQPSVMNTFERGSEALLVENGVWEMGKPNKNTLETTGSKMYATKLTGNYPDGVKSYLYTKYYDLSQIEAPVLKFKMAFDIEKNWDYLLVEYSTNMGKDWSVLGTSSDANWYNSNASATPNLTVQLPGNQWTGYGNDPSLLGGTNATMHEYSYNLKSITSKATILFRFVFYADAHVGKEGVVIDDLFIGDSKEVLSKKEFELNDQLSIAPNPSQGVFHVTLGTVENAVDVVVFDVLGKKVFEQKNIQETSFPIDITGFSEGVYLLRIHSKDKVGIKKLLLR